MRRLCWASHPNVRCTVLTERMLAQCDATQRGLPLAQCVRQVSGTVTHVADKDGSRSYYQSGTVGGLEMASLWSVSPVNATQGKFWQTSILIAELRDGYPENVRHLRCADLST